MPVLGICRGMQMLNVARGGTLDQHLPDVGRQRRPSRTPPGTFSDHEVRLEPGSLAARAAGAERVAVRSHHHQGVDRLGEGLTATRLVGRRRADRGDRAARTDAFALGVLWHPEEDERSQRDRRRWSSAASAQEA